MLEESVIVFENGNVCFVSPRFIASGLTIGGLISKTLYSEKNKQISTESFVNIMDSMHDSQSRFTENGIILLEKDGLQRLEFLRKRHLRRADVLSLLNTGSYKSFDQETLVAKYREYIEKDDLMKSVKNTESLFGTVSDMVFDIQTNTFKSFIENIISDIKNYRRIDDLSSKILERVEEAKSSLNMKSDEFKTTIDNIDITTLPSGKKDDLENRLNKLKKESNEIVFSLGDARPSDLRYGCKLLLFLCLAPTLRSEVETPFLRPSVIAPILRL